MSTGPIQELVVPYDPSVLLARSERRRRLVRSRVLSLVITVVIMVGLYAWQRDQLQGAGFVLVYALVFGVSLAWLVGSAALYLRVRRELQGIGSGTAVRISPAGMEVAGVAAGWPQVASVGTVKGGLGRSPRLRLTLSDGREAQVPLDQLAVLPATLDSAARAFSSGRHGVDLTALDN